MCKSIKFIHFNEVDSTNDIALNLLSENMQLQDDNGIKFIVVTADFQKRGRGRNGHEWLGEKNNNLYFSFALSHSLREIELYFLQVIGSLAVYEVLGNYFDYNRIKIKYPNDVYVLDKNGNNAKFKKISGIISETNFINEKKCHSIIGIGINIKQINFSNEIAGNTTSLALLEINFGDNIIEKISKELADKIVDLLQYDKKQIFNNWKNIINIENKEVALLSTPVKRLMVEKILSDCRLLAIDENGMEVIIDNGNSIRYEL